VPFDAWKHHRRSVRLKGYDYSQEGAYVVTICTFQRESLFGSINDAGEMDMNAWGGIAASCWVAIPAHFPHVDLDAFIVMPNHIHGIVVIVDRPKTVGTQHVASDPHLSKTFAKVARGSLSAIVRSFKAAVTLQINRQRDTPSAPIWQGRFYDNIIHNEQMLDRFRFYIDNNPSQWAADRYHL
jgi:putative transposase